MRTSMSAAIVVSLLLTGHAVGADDPVPDKLVDFRTLDAVIERLHDDILDEPDYQTEQPNIRLMESRAPVIEQRAKAGDRLAQFQIATMYLEGLGVHQNIGRAWHWFQQAGGPDHPLALTARGRFFWKVAEGNSFERRARDAALEALGKIESAAAIPELERLFDGGDFGAAKALAQIGGRGAEIVIARLASDDVAQRRAAAAALMESTAAARLGFDALQRAKNDADPKVRESAAGALIRMERDEARLQRLAEGKPEWPQRPPGPKSDKAAADIDALIAQLADPSAGARAAAALKLRDFREQADAAVPSLVRLLEDADDQVRVNSAQAVAWIGPGRAAFDPVPALMKALDDASPDVREEAAGALRRNWPDVERAIPKLIGCLGDRLANGKGAATDARYTLMDFGRRREPKALVEALRAELRRTEAGPPAAVNVLASIGPAAGAALPELTPLLKHTNPDLRRSAAVAIGRVGGDPTEALALLLADLRADFVHDRDGALRHLAQMGPSAAGAVPEILQFVKEPIEQAVSSLRRAAAGGSPDGCYSLGMTLLHDDYRVPHDPAQAARLFRQAADQGHAEAQRQLGKLYRQGRGVKRDDAEANRWYRKSAELRTVELLRWPRVAQENYDVVRRLHDDDAWQPWGSNGAAERRMLSITYLSDLARHRADITVLTSGGIWRTWEWRSGFMGKGGIPSPDGRLVPAEQKQLQATLDKLPKGVDFCPVDQQILLSRHVAGKWTTEIYDTAMLPRSVRMLLHRFAMLHRGVDPDWRLSPRPQYLGAAQLREVVYQPDGTLLARGYEERIRALRDGAVVDVPGTKLGELPGMPIAVSPDGARAVTYREERLHLVDAVAGRTIVELDRPGRFPWNDGSARFSADSKVMAAVIEGTNIVIRESDNGTLRRRFIKLRPLSLSHDGALLAATTEKGDAVELYGTHDGKLRHSFAVHAGDAAFSPAGTQLAMMLSEGVAFADVATGDLRMPSGPYVRGTFVRYSPGGWLVACRREHDDFMLIDAVTGEVRGLAGRHGRFDMNNHSTGEIVDLEFSPDGRSIVTACDDGTIKIWSVAEICRDDDLPGR